MHSEAVNSELFDNLRLELRRGCLVVAVLAQLPPNIMAMLSVRHWPIKA